jgi:metal-sulfur cluster biosynthetic enzyme
VTSRAQVFEALGTVYDPELDEPITTLGFVGSCVVDGDDVSVRLRLPTPQCAPNFAFLMAADAAAAVRTVAGGSVRVVLEDHYTGEEINAAVNRGEEFSDAFPGETEGQLSALRALFQRKALLARQSRLRSAATTLGELEGPDADRCRELRRALGIDASDEAPAFVTGDGSPVDPSDVRFWRMASLTALSLDVNGGMCRDLLKTRYGEEVAA